jgi:ribosome-binding factor A
MDELRSARVAERMREELSELVRFECSDPRLAEVDVTEVIVSPDMSRADVLVVLPADAERRESAMAGLMAAKAYLRRQVAKRVELFKTPELYFRLNAETTATGPVLNKLMRRIRRGRPRG